MFFFKQVSLVKNQNDLKLDFKVFSLLILVVKALYLMNPTDATLASLNVLKYERWRPRWPSVRQYMANILDKKHFNFNFLRMLRG